MKDFQNVEGSVDTVEELICRAVDRTLATILVVPAIADLPEGAMLNEFDLAFQGYTEPRILVAPAENLATTMEMPIVQIIELRLESA